MGATMDDVKNELAACRGREADDVLAGATLHWLAELPANVRPQHLPVKFPRMANTLACRWVDRRACLAYLDDLLIDNRGTRSGFPLEIVDELASLKDYFQTVVYPVPQTVWDEVAERRKIG